MKKFIIKNYKSILTISAIIISIIMLLLISYYQLDITNQNYTIGNKLSNKDYKNGQLKEIIEGSIITQEFVAKENNLERLKLNININDEVEGYLNGNLKAILKDETGTIIKEETIKYDILSVNPDYEFIFKKQKGSNGKKYSLILKLDQNKEMFDAEKYSAVSLKTTQKEIEDCTLYCNDTKINEKIYVVDSYNSTVRTLFFNATVGLLSALSLVLSIVVYKKKNLTVEKLFLMVMPIICILFMIYMPMFRANDECRHWYRAYEVSEGKFITESEDGKITSKLPKSIETIYTGWRNVRYGDVVKAFDERLNPDDRKVIKDLYTTATYSPIQYLPMSIGIFIARIFTDRVIVMAYMARLTNIIFCIAILYIAIKNLPFGKKLFFVISAIPITVQGISTISADGITIAMCLLSIAYILKLRYNDKHEAITLKDKIILTSVLVVVALCKIVYVLFILLLLMLPKKKFKNRKDQILTIIVIGAIVCLTSMLWLHISSRYTQTDISGQLKKQSVISHPIEYLKLQLYTLDNMGETYWDLTFGGKLGWGRTTDLFMLVPSAFFIMCIITSIWDNKIKNKFKIFDILVFLFIILGVIALAFLAMHLYYSPWDNEFIKGVQGRYFIPILPLIFFGLGSIIKIKSEYENKNIIKLIGIVTIVLQVNIILSLTIVHLK